jgi:hypothetical protein
MQISKYFSLKEFTSSETAMKKGYTENFNPPTEIIENLKKLAEKVADPIRVEWGAFSPTVGYRCPRLNFDKDIKGAKNSQHLLGQAFDETFIHDGKNISEQVFFWLVNNRNKIPFTKLIWEKGNEVQPRWLHIGYTEGAKQEIMYTFDGKGYVNYFGSILEKHHKSLGKIS